MYAWRARENGGYFGCDASVTADPNWNSCVFCLSGQGANGSTPATDTTGKALTWNSCSVSTSQSKWYGSSIYIPPSTNYITVNPGAFTAIAGDFTIRVWVYFVDSSAVCAVLGTADMNTTGCAIRRFISGGNTRLVSFYAGATIAGVNLFSVSQIPDATWTHIEVGRSGNNWMLFINGVLEAAVTYATASAIAVENGSFLLGAAIAGGSPYCYGNQYMNDIQIYNGVCLHTSSFIPPTRDALCSARRYPGGVFGV